MRDEKNKILMILLLGYIIFSPLLILSQEKQYTEPTSDSTSTEYWRQKGYKARINNEPDLALAFYNRVLIIDEQDWDANLAVARLFYAKENYKKAMANYEVIYSNDTTDVEALWGKGRCFFRMGKYEDAINWLEKANTYLNRHIPLKVDLANSYTNNNQLNNAINIYKDIIAIDSTYANAWAGIGKMYFWSGKPATSVKYYKKALSLDKDNKELLAQYQRVKREMLFSVNYQLHFNNEREPLDIGSDTFSYNIDAVVQRLIIHKRVNDWLLLSFGTLLDHSYRQYAWQDSVKRYYDNSYLRAMLLMGNHKINIHCGVSKTDTLLSTYGIAWEYAKRFKGLKFSNNIALGYDYYYYWNQVGHDFLTESIKFEYKNFSLEGFYRYSNVREMYVYDLDTLARNPNHLYSFSGRYKFLKNPVITVGVSHQYRDYKYISPFYWSPQERTLNSANMGVNWKITEKLYTFIYGNLGKDNYDVSFWEASGEIGYHIKNSGISAGIARFYNPWYENLDIYLSLSQKF